MKTKQDQMIAISFAVALMILGSLIIYNLSNRVDSQQETIIRQSNSIDSLNVQLGWYEVQWDNQNDPGSN